MKRPHAVSITLSVLALAVSLASWIEAHESRKVNEASSRAALYASAMTGEKPEWFGATTQCALTVSNLGKAVADNVIIKYRYQFYAPGNAIDSEPTGPLSLESMGPGYSYTFPIHIFTEDKKSIETFGNNNPVQFWVKGTVSYRDSSSGKPFEQSWCFHGMGKAGLPVLGSLKPCGEEYHTIYEKLAP